MIGAKKLRCGFPGLADVRLDITAIALTLQALDKCISATFKRSTGYETQGQGNDTDRNQI